MRNDNMQTFTVEDYSLNPVIVHKNNIISKNVLDENIYGLWSVDIQNIGKNQLCPISDQKMVFFKINGITQFWKTDEKFDIKEQKNIQECQN